MHDVKLLLVQEAHSEAGSDSNPRLSDARCTTSDIIAPNCCIHLNTRQILQTNPTEAWDTRTER